MDFVIGNGMGFEEKDVILAIRNLDFESKVKIVEVIVDNFFELIEKSKKEVSTTEDKESGIVAKQSLEEVMQHIVRLISNKG